MLAASTEHYLSQVNPVSLVTFDCASKGCKSYFATLKTSLAWNFKTMIESLAWNQTLNSQVATEPLCLIKMGILSNRFQKWKYPIKNLHYWNSDIVNLKFTSCLLPNSTWQRYNLNCSGKYQEIVE